MDSDSVADDVAVTPTIVVVVVAVTAVAAMIAALSFVFFLFPPFFAPANVKVASVAF